MNLLYIEDDPVKAYEVQRVIISAGIRDYDIIKCSTYPQAEEMLDKMKFDIIVSDMFYPGADGKKVAGGEMIIQKANLTAGKPPVIIISSQAFNIPEAAVCIWYNENEIWEEKLRKALKDYIQK